jgi:hydroxymethylglutaryl-CoA synthase
MSQLKIEAVGAYAPRFRVSAEAFEEAWGQFHAAGVSEKAIPDADEDALTMAYEAAARALDAVDRAGADVSFLAFASTMPPLAEEDLTARLGGMLGVRQSATRHVFTGSTRAGTRALDVALRAGPWDSEASGESSLPDASEESVGLVVAADCPRAEPDSSEDHAAGAGAAAFLLSESDGDGDGAAVRRRAEYAEEFPGTRFRQTGSETVEGLGATGYERQAFTETLGGAVEQLDLGDAEEIDAAAVQAPNGKLPYRAAGALGVDTETIRAGTTVHELGDTAAASVPLGLAKALAAGAERVLAASFGSGAGADALLVEAGDDGVAAELSLRDGESVSYAEYLRKRGELTSGPPEGGGAYVSVPSWKRTLDQRHRLLAGKCPDCGGLNFPPEGACNACKTLVEEYEEVKLTGEGRVEASTVISQGGAPPEFAEQQAQSGDFGVAVVALEGPHEARSDSERLSEEEERRDDPRDGESASIPAQIVGAEAGSVEIGDRVETTMRRIYTQEGVTRYGFKVRPA